MMLQGDAREVLAGLDTGSVHAVFTSPPYYEQRAYGDDDREIGRGSYTGYLDALGQVVDQCERLLTPDGWMGWVIGDKAAGSGGAGGDHTSGSKQWIAKYGKVASLRDSHGILDGQFIMVPYDFARMCQQRGWLMRTMIVWDKSPTLKPEDPEHINRPMISTERIVLLTRGPARRWRYDMLPDRGDVWRVRPHRGPKAPRHFAPFPGELARRFILATTERGMTVLDPFAGSGTTVRIANALHRVGVGVELYATGGK